ncbi:MAG: CDP-alcohol phosphatidyltransferase family protein [Candidatus Undinarchaeales archaeon]|jgi:archaetidylinositol phosphate synthase|nr:CDP-alcohol phosphatidyltransferase family protein [Candidatus Undinarchaeales archaeon]MDP7491672.1 CDP-alcohol phosphatidyltransferase family protein [Candidatus Undinarchaeales archaeon]
MLSQLRPQLAPFFESMARSTTSVTTNPFVFTMLGLVTSLGASVLIVKGMWLYAAFAIGLVGIFDVLDGALARVTGTVTTFGGFLDSVVDRFTEMFILTGLLLSGAVPATWCMLALFGSLMVSYTRARAESLLDDIPMGGIGQRAERLVVLAFGCGLSHWDIDYLVPFIMFLCALTGVTVAQRIMVMWRRCEKDSSREG